MKNENVHEWSGIYFLWNMKISFIMWQQKMNNSTNNILKISITLFNFSNKPLNRVFNHYRRKKEFCFFHFLIKFAWTLRRNGILYYHWGIIITFINFHINSKAKSSLQFYLNGSQPFRFLVRYLVDFPQQSQTCLNQLLLNLGGIIYSSFIIKKLINLPTVEIWSSKSLETVG